MGRSKAGEYTTYKEWWAGFIEQGLCPKCKEHRPLAENSCSFCERCKVKQARHTVARRRRNPELYLWHKAKTRAKAQGVPFEITPDDIHIPDTCPVLGIKLKRGVGYPTDCSPSLDKVIPQLGYVPGNVCVISRRANGLKNNATLQELEALVKYVKSFIAKTN